MCIYNRILQEHNQLLDFTLTARLKHLKDKDDEAIL
jgi:hypothetical protein